MYIYLPGRTVFPQKRVSVTILCFAVFVWKKNGLPLSMERPIERMHRVQKRFIRTRNLS